MRTPFPPVRLLASATLLLVSVVAFTAAWVVQTGSDSPGAVLAAGAIVVLAALGAGWVDWVLFRPRRDHVSAHVLGYAATAAALGVVVWTGALDVWPFMVVWAATLGLLVLRPLLGAVQASERPKHIWWELLAGVGIWALALAVYVGLGPSLPGWDHLVWGSADQLLLYRHSAELATGTFEVRSYLLGLPALLTPVWVLVGGNDVAATNHANRFTLGVYQTIIMPVLLWLVAVAACRAAGVKAQGRKVMVGMGVMAALVCAYSFLPPGYVLTRNADLVPRRLFGLVFGPEPLGFLALAGGALLLAAGTRARWRPVPVGVAVGLVMMAHERFVPTALVFLGVLLIQPLQRRKGMVVAATAFLTFLPQLLYFRFVYGGWLFPNRDHQWGDDREVIWGEHVQERFNVSGPGPPDRMSLDYLGVNASDMLAAYWPALVVIVVSLAVLVWRVPSRWPLWIFVVAHCVGTFVMSALYINEVVTWRYMAMVLPVVGVLVLAALWVLTSGDEDGPQGQLDGAEAEPSSVRARHLRAGAPPSGGVHEADGRSGSVGVSGSGRC